VLGGLSPHLIEDGRLTVAGFLRSQGYHTAAIGKWHLGMDWARLPGKDVTELAIETPAQVRNVDFAQPIRHGPTTVGFDEYFGISASLDMVPYTFIANDHVVSLPTLDRSFDWVLGSTRKTRHGPAAPDFDAADVLPTLTQRAVDYIGRRATAARQGQPFFLYLPLASPHTPILPTKEWQGRSGLNYYADFVMQTDDSVGQVLAALDRAGVADNTLIIFTSDNGCSPEADTAFLTAHGHRPSADRRGYKADAYDGGHHVPFIVRWPGHVAPGGRSGAFVSLGDFFATCADIVGAPIPADAAEDSISFLPVLQGRPGAAPRDTLVHHSINGSFAVRQGEWKLILAPGSGGWSAPRPGVDSVAGLPPVQLFNVRTDVAEAKNVQAAHPDVVARLTVLLERYVADGRSTAGPAQTNTVPVDIRRAKHAEPAAGKAAKKSGKIQ
jgi:arylsulfatase A-like enzyme